MADVRELARLIEQYTGSDGIHTTAIPRLILYRASQMEEPMHAVYEPAVCIVAQGRKQSIAGEGVYVYDAEKYLVVSVGVPAVGRGCVKTRVEIFVVGPHISERVQIAAVVESTCH